MGSLPGSSPLRLLVPGLNVVEIETLSLVCLTKRFAIIEFYCIILLWVVQCVSILPYPQGSLPSSSPFRHLVTGLNVVRLMTHLETLSTIKSQVRLGQIRLGQIRLGQIRLGQIRLGQIRLGQIRLGQIRLRQIRFFNEFFTWQLPSQVPCPWVQRCSNVNTFTNIVYHFKLGQVLQ